MNNKTKIFAVSDIHGHATEFRTALDTSGFDKNDPEHLLVVVGDCFDRGNENRAVLEILKEIKNKVLVRGNHEDKLLRVLNTHRLDATDMYNGTDTTVIEFFGEDGIDEGQLTPDKDTARMLRDFIAEMQDYFETENYIFTHGWLPLDRTDEQRPKLRRDWHHAEYSEWKLAHFIGWQDVYPLGIKAENKTVVCGHRAAAYASRFDKSRSPKDSTPFFGDGMIAIDALTVVSHRVNVLILEDRLLPTRTLTMSLLAKPYELMKAGEKRIEMRLFDEKRAKISVGDIITFHRADAPDDSLNTRVTGLYRYRDFERLSEDFLPHELGIPEEFDFDAADLMNVIYPEESIEKYGTLAIRILPI